MASSDEDDIESLRLAALASIKPKVDQEPQGIQVVSSIQQPVAPVQPYFEQQPVQQYFDQQPVPQYFEHKPVPPYFEHKPVPPYFEQNPVEHIDPHFAALHHAFLQHQQHIQQQQQQPPPFFVRGRGNFRGRGFFPRGRGRGRGYNMFQPDMNNFHVTPVQPQSALIVIQTEVPEAEKKKSQEPRPLFLRPQDKWGLTNTSSRGSSPKPKDTSKFSRYDSNSDSDDDFEAMETENVDNAEAEEELDRDDNLEDESNDTDKSIDNSLVETEDIQSDNNSEDVNNDIDESEENDNFIANNPMRIVRVKGENEKLELLDKSDEKLLEENADELLNTNTESTVSNSNESGACANGHKLEAAPDNVEDELKTGDNMNCDTEIESHTDPEATTASITDGNLMSEIQQDESVSNSYKPFSRFNRRRKKSDSGEESESENDDENSKHSNWSTASKDKLQNESDDSADLEPDLGTHELEVEAIKVDQRSVKEKTILSRSSSKSASKSQVGSSSRSSSSSSSSSSSASSSSSSSTSSSRNSSPEPSKKAEIQDKTSLPKLKENNSDQKVSKLNNVNDASKMRSNSFSDIKISDSRDKNKESGRAKYMDRNHIGDGHRRNSASDVKPKSDRVRVEKSLSPKRKSYTSSQRSRSPRPTSGRSRTPDRKSKHYSVSPLRDKSAVVAADPEFDAANYRGDGVFHRERTKRKNDPGKSEKENKQSIERQDISAKDRRRSDIDSEVRYFKEITKLKSEQSKEPRKMASQEYNKNDIHTEKRHRKDDRVAKDQSVRASQSEHLVKKNSKDRNRTRSISPKLDRKQYKRSKSKSPVLKDSRSKTNPKYSKSSENFVDKKYKDLRTSKSSTELERERRRDRHDKNTKVPERKNKIKSVNDKGKDVTNKEKRRSIEEKLKKIANLSSSSSSDSDSNKSVSSLSDMSSDSESETWRNKKTGASRKADDIVRERQRRRMLDREKRRNLEREREKGDGDRSRKRNQERHKNEQQNRPEKAVDKKHKLDIGVRDRHLENKKSVFCAEDSKRKPVFEELSSDSDTGRSKHRRVSSIVKPNIPSLLDIKVSKTNLSKLDKHATNERLVIQVGKSSDEDADGVKGKTRHKKTKKGEKRKKSSDNLSDDENSIWSRKHVVNVTFNDDSGSDSGNPRRSVYDRLGIQVSTENNQRSSKSKSKKQPDIVVPSGDKKIKINDLDKHSSKKQKKSSKREQDPDEALNKRIRKIQEKNAEILRRKMEVEQDRQKYG